MRAWRTRAAASTSAASRRDETQIIVATIAFGMGINKSNVRFILHAALPENLENYYQQIGRAGRDGLRADCLLLWGRRDIHTIRHFIDEGPESERPGKEARLQAMLRYAQATGCRRDPLLAYFGETAPDSSATCATTAGRGTRRGGRDGRHDRPARLFVECVQADRRDVRCGAHHGYPARVAQQDTCSAGSTTACRCTARDAPVAQAVARARPSN